MISAPKTEEERIEREVSIDAGKVKLEGSLALPKDACGIVLFAHGSGSSRHSPRNRYVAQVLQSRGIATLLFDLLTRDEDAVDQWTAKLRFDIRLLAERLVGATEWTMRNPKTQPLKVGYFGASTGAAAALVAAARLPDAVGAVVSRGGRPDLAEDDLGSVRAPTLLIVGGNDDLVIELNRHALAKLQCAKEMVIIPGASHLFEEPGKLEEVARVAAAWFADHFVQPAQSQPHAAKLS